MKAMKRIVAGSLACATLAASAVSLTGCGSTWALKTDDAEVSSGVYRYALAYAYQYAMYNVDDYTQPVFSQEIDGEPAADYVRQAALDYFIKGYLVIEEKMKELDLSLSDVERYNAETAAKEDWNSDDFASYKEMFESYGITQDDYQKAYYDYSAKYSKVFQAIYGEGGEKEVSREEMEEYFTKNYSNIRYIVASTSGMTDEEIKDTTKQFKGYADEIKDGKTLEDIDKEYTASLHEDETADDTSSAATESTADGETEEETNLISRIGLLTTTSYPEAMVTAVGKMKNGAVQVVDASDSGYIILLEKNNIKDAIETFLDNEDEEQRQDNRFQLLANMKEEDFTAYINDLCENYDESRITYNPAETTELDLAAIFEPDSVASEETASEETSSKEDAASEAEASSAAESTASGE